MQYGPEHVRMLKTGAKFLPRFFKIYEFPHRAYITQVHPFLDANPEFNALAKRINDKQDTVFIASQDGIQTLLGGAVRQKIARKLPDKTYEIFIRGQNDLMSSTLYIYLHTDYSRVTLQDCAFQRIMIFAKRIKTLTLVKTTVICLNVHRCKELGEILLKNESRLVADNAKVREEVRIVDEGSQQYEAVYWPIVDEIEAAHLLASDFLSSDSFG